MAGIVSNGYRLLEMDGMTGNGWKWMNIDGHKWKC